MLPRPASVFDAPAPTGAVYRMPDDRSERVSAIRIGQYLYLPDEPLTQMIQTRYRDLIDRLLTVERMAWQDLRRVDSNKYAFDSVDRWLREEQQRTQMRGAGYVIIFTLIYNDNPNSYAQNTVGVRIDAKPDNQEGTIPVKFVSLPAGAYARPVELPIRTGSPPPPSPTPWPAPASSSGRPEARFLTDRYNAAMNRGAHVYEPPHGS